MTDKGPRLLDGLTSTMTYGQMRHYADTLNVTISSALLPQACQASTMKPPEPSSSTDSSSTVKNAAPSSTNSSTGSTPTPPERRLRRTPGTQNTTRNRAKAHQPTRIPDSRSHVRKQPIPDRLRTRRHTPNHQRLPAHTRFEPHALQSTELIPNKHDHRTKQLIAKAD